MNLYTRARKHIDMSRVKELREENIYKQKIAKIKFQEEKILLEKKRVEVLEDPRYSNWKRELAEGTPVPIEESMTTTAIFSMHLEPSDEVLTHIPSTTISSADNEGSPTENGVVPRVQSFEIVDASKTDTITLTISGSFTTKTIDGSTISDKVSVGVLVGGTYGGNYLAGGDLNAELGNGTHTITIPQKFRKAGVKFDVIQITAFQGGGGPESSPVSVTGVGLKRLNRMTAFVSLDDPEATAFIRSTLANENLSPDQKKKKLEEMLGASAEYLTKMFGEGIFTGASELSDVQVQQSFAQIAQGLPYVDEDDAFDDDYYQGPVPDYMDDSDVDLPIELANAGPSTPVKTDSDGRIVPYMGGGRPGKIRPQQGPRQADKKKPKQLQYAHYEPEGEIIVEKKLKSPSSLLDKIPGYYDGKPAPLGFPIEEPPKMVNGKHPDLVDGKKVSQRYNRLDPISAKAMPKTGNKHIDSKVAKARSKAK